ncbi:MAG TPA: type II secretion system protein N [Crinalium sp.]
MSQDASTRTKLLKPSDASPFSPERLGDVTESGSFPVESYADRLMDDLFGDVERLLDSSATLAVEPERVEPSAPLAKGTPLDNLVGLVSPLMRRADVDGALALDEPDADALLANRDMTERSLTQQPLTTSIGQPARSYDRLLLGVGCLSILVTLGVWFLNQQASRPPAPVAVSPQVPAGNAAPQNSTANDQFVNYLQQALKAIEQQQTGSPQVASSGALPNLPLVQPGSPTVQPPSTPSTSVATPRPTLRPATGLSRLYGPTYQAPQAQLRSPSVAPLPPASAPANAPVAVRPPIPLSMPGIPKKLVGVLELGDRSAALIEINGVTQRYRIGESIGTSGWSLVEVSKDQAVLRRNGEVRSVFMGQNF